MVYNERIVELIILYIDACCYSRPYDNPDHLAQASVLAEIAAIYAIIGLCKEAKYSIAGSAAVTEELGDTPQADKLEKSLKDYNEAVNMHIPLTADISRRAQELANAGLKEYDAYHLAYAEAAGARYLLTVDRRFWRKCQRENLSTVNVVNPSTLLPEVIKWVQQQ